MSRVANLLTRWRSHYTSSDVRYTTREAALYAIVMAPPTNGRVVLNRLAPSSGLFDAPVSSVRLVGSNSDLEWSQSPNGLEVLLPAPPVESGPFALKIEAPVKRFSRGEIARPLGQARLFLDVYFRGSLATRVSR